MTELRIDAHVPEVSDETIDAATTAEDLGFDAVWTAETAHDPFLPHPLIAEHTDEIDMGTQIATSFTRSPMVLAYTSWDIQRYSDGRFILGLGTQVKGHNERRFSVDFEWEQPGPRLREEVRAIKHIFDVFQGDEEDLDFDGEFYQFSLMTDTFRPEPIESDAPPIYVAGVNEYNIRTAGAVADGLCMHPFNTPKYTDEVIAPLVEDAASEAGRSLNDVDLVAGPFVITGTTDEEWERTKAEAKQRIAFYGSTRTYHDVFENHGFDDIGMKLHELSKEGKWQEMAALIDDDVLDAFAIRADPEDLVDAVEEKYGGIADRVSLPLEFGEHFMS
ncbi:MAG: TIGR03617 family F420-dependent LLM class oxidoreductase [Natronomonas sp.]